MTHGSSSPYLGWPERLLRSIELYGREVMPRVRRLLAEVVPVRAEGGVTASGR